MPDERRSRLDEFLEMTRQGTGAFWLRLRKWFIVAVIVGVLVGALTGLIEYVALAVLWGHISIALNPAGIVALPTLGLFISGLCLHFTKEPDVHGTEEYIEAFHDRNGVHHFGSFPLKLLAAISTVGLGGSAGLEAPSIYAGGVIGSWVVQRLARFGFTEDDVRDLMVAGSAAGISAIFKAPLTGIVFALEVPYTDDLAREALVPALVASVTSYIVFVSFVGVRPLFEVTERYSLSLADVGYAVGLGLIVGLGARMFVATYRWIRERVKRLPVPIYVKTTVGGFVCGLVGLASYRVFGSPAALGIGYDSISLAVTGHYTATQAAWLLLLKGIAVLATLGSGAAGGIFVPMILLGAASGALLKGLSPGVAREGALFPVAGMAAFLAAGYRAPIAAAVFVAESTGGSGYLIPGLITAAVAYSVAGRFSVSTEQRWRRQTTLDRLLGLKVRDIMTLEVVSVPAALSLDEFVRDFVVRLHHADFPVVQDDALVGVISLSDVSPLPHTSWQGTCVGDVMIRNVATTTADESVGNVVELMAERNVDRLPVVDEHNRRRIVGIVSSTDVIALDDVSAAWVERRVSQRRTDGSV